MAKLKPNRVQYVPLSDVMHGKPHALQAFEDSGSHSYGDNDITLVKRDTLIKTLKEIGLDDDEEEISDEIDEVIEYLEEELPETMYIDLES